MNHMQFFMLLAIAGYLLLPAIVPWREQTNKNPLVILFIFIVLWTLPVLLWMIIPNASFLPGLYWLFPPVSWVWYSLRFLRSLHKSYARWFGVCLVGLGTYIAVPFLYAILPFALKNSYIFLIWLFAMLLVPVSATLAVVYKAIRNDSRAKQ